MDPTYVSKGPDFKGVFIVGPRIRLSYELYRPDPAQHPEPAGRMMVLWGALATSQHFVQEADLLKAHGYEVLLFDHRGVCGSGPCSLEQQDCKLLAQDALALLDCVWPGQAVHVYGASMGGMVAQELAFLLLNTSPTPRLASLMLSVTCRGLPGGNILARLGWARPWVLRPLVGWWYGSDKALIVRRLMKKVFTKDYMCARHPCGQTYREVHERVWVEHFDKLFTFSDHNTTACHTSILLTHWLSGNKVAALRDSGAPILVQVSSHDALVPPVLQHMLAQDLRAHKVTLPIGHMGVHQYQQRFHAMFLEHLAAASAARAVAHKDACLVAAPAAKLQALAEPLVLSQKDVVHVDAFAAA